MNLLRLSISVLDGSQPMGASGRLFLREMLSPWRPDRGHRMVLFPYDQAKPDDGPMVSVHEVWWGFDGAVRVEFEPLVVDPCPERHARIMREAAEGTVHRREQGWWTQDGKDVGELLTGAGWRLYA